MLPTNHLEDIIKFEPENSSVEFKKKGYHKEEHGELIKDIMALANARTSPVRYLIMGIKAYPDGRKDFLGIQSFEDDASFQQLIHSNIEPDIPFHFYPYELEGLTYGIFEIGPCKNPPYLMKKGFKKLHEGMGYIRKGSSSFLLKRGDYDSFYTQKFNDSEFDGEIELKPIVNDIPSAQLPAFVKSQSYPSEKAEERIKSQIKKNQEGIVQKEKQLIHGYFLNFPNRGKSSEELTADLENVKEKYVSEDQYYLFEIDGVKLDFEIEVLGSKYLEDTYFEFSVEKDRILVAERLFPNPDLKFNMGHYLNNAGYPEVETVGDKYIIRQSVGDLRHQVPTRIFEEPLRLVCLKETDEEFVMEVKIFAKNLRKPMVQKINLVSD